MLSFPRASVHRLYNTEQVFLLFCPLLVDHNCRWSTPFLFNLVACFIIMIKIYICLCVCLLPSWAIWGIHKWWDCRNQTLWNVSNLLQPEIKWTDADLNSFQLWNLAEVQVCKWNTFCNSSKFLPCVLQIHWTLLHHHTAVFLLLGLFRGWSFLPGPHRDCGWEAAHTGRPGNLVVCGPNSAYHRWTDAQRLQ